MSAGLDSARDRLVLVLARLPVGSFSVSHSKFSAEEFLERLDFGGGGGKDLLLGRVRVRVETVAEAETFRSDR